MGLAMATSRPRDRINFEHGRKTFLSLSLYVCIYIYIKTVHNPASNYCFSSCEIDFFSRTKRSRSRKIELE